MKLKDILELIFQKTKATIIVTFPYGSGKSQYRIHEKPMLKKALLESKKVAPFLDHEIHFINTALVQDAKTDMYFPQIDIFIWG